MNSLAFDYAPLAAEVVCSDVELTVSLIDGRTVSVPLAWFPRLANATPEQLNNLEIMGGGEGIHWPDIDEDVSVRGLLEGRSAVSN